MCLLVQAGGKLGLGGFRRRARVQLTSLPLLSLLCSGSHPALGWIMGHTLVRAEKWVTLTGLCPSGDLLGSHSPGCALVEFLLGSRSLGGALADSGSHWGFAPVRCAGRAASLMPTRRVGRLMTGCGKHLRRPLNTLRGLRLR